MNEVGNVSCTEPELQDFYAKLQRWYEKVSNIQHWVPNYLEGFREITSLIAQYKSQCVENRLSDLPRPVSVLSILSNLQRQNPGYILRALELHRVAELVRTPDYPILAGDESFSDLVKTIVQMTRHTDQKHFPPLHQIIRKDLDDHPLLGDEVVKILDECLSKIERARVISVDAVIELGWMISREGNVDHLVTLVEKIIQRCRSHKTTFSTAETERFFVRNFLLEDVKVCTLLIQKMCKVVCQPDQSQDPFEKAAPIVPAFFQVNVVLCHLKNFHLSFMFYQLASKLKTMSRYVHPELFSSARFRRKLKEFVTVTNSVADGDLVDMPRRLSDGYVDGLFDKDFEDVPFSLVQIIIFMIQEQKLINARKVNVATIYNMITDFLHMNKGTSPVSSSESSVQWWRLHQMELLSLDSQVAVDAIDRTSSILLTSGLIVIEPLHTDSNSVHCKVMKVIEIPPEIIRACFPGDEFSDCLSAVSLFDAFYFASLDKMTKEEQLERRKMRTKSTEGLKQYCDSRNLLSFVSNVEWRGLYTSFVPVNYAESSLYGIPSWVKAPVAT